jgi:hypothetical protein
MTEDFLHYIWRTRNFNFRNLKTTDNLPVEILDFGQWNSHGGPDFLMGRVLIDGTEWIGNIEIHITSSEWNRHGHTVDAAYESVILHVVLQEDMPVYAGDRKLHCIELKDRIDASLLGQYLRLLANEAWVPCAQNLPAVSPVIRAHWLERMSAERLQMRSDAIMQTLAETRDDWEVVFYHTLAAAFGFKVNATPFARLVRLVPLNIVKRHLDSDLQIAALYFGCAGLLNRIFTDAYPIRLQKEFHHLSAKYDLSAIDDARGASGGIVSPPPCEP